MRDRILFVFIVATLVLASFACNYPMRNTGSDAIPVTTEAAQSLQDDLSTAIEQLRQSGKVRLAINEEELTSMLTLEVQKQENPVLENPQVYLRDGRMRVIGRVNQGGLSANLEVVLEITVADDGKSRYQIIEATVGSIPLPNSMMDNLSNQIDAAFQSNISPLIADLFIESITIADGEMVIVGYAVM